MVLNTTDQSLESLKDNPIFQLSLASKELFHSNFLYWLGVNEHLKGFFVQVIFGLSDGVVNLSGMSYVVKREQGKFDFCIRVVQNGKEGQLLFVLENILKCHTQRLHSCCNHKSNVFYIFQTFTATCAILLWRLTILASFHSS